MFDFLCNGVVGSATRWVSSCWQNPLSEMPKTCSLRTWQDLVQL